MDRERAMLENALSGRKSALKNYLKMCETFKRIPKPAEASDAFRLSGNALYTQKPHDNSIHMQIFFNYCRAILTAPNDSEHLALGYGNRSAFLLHIKKYEDCIKDIDRAVKITRSNELKIKLLCRKAECLKKLGSSEDKNVLKEADKYVDRIDDKKSKRTYNNLIEKMKNMSVNVDIDNAEKQRNAPKTEDATDCIRIGYDKKFGRHLLAKKDYAPGDIIFVEKPYAVHINPRMIFTNCDFCLKTAWSGIACRHCSWLIFCSEDCRDKAMDAYHDVECSLIPLLKGTLGELFNMTRLNLRAVIIALKEAGSVTELMSRLKAVDNCTDMILKGFYKNGEFSSDTIESLYSLCSHYPEPDYVFEGQASCVLMILIGLATQTKILKNCTLRKIDDLIKSKELLFLGSLMMKLIMIRRNTNDAFDNNYQTCEQESGQQCVDSFCCTRGSFMASLTSLINHSCFPNASRCFTNNKEIIIHAIHPIKKDEQIFMVYQCFFYDLPLSSRKELLKIRNIFNCFCQPCKENWPQLLSMPAELLDKYDMGIKTEFENKLYESCSRILAAFQTDSIVKNKFAYCKKKDLEKLSKAVTEVFQHTKQPSYLTCLLVQSLDKVFLHRYGLKPRHFGICDQYQYSLKN